MYRLGWKIICLVVSFLIWIWVASDTPTEETLPLPVEVRLDEGSTLAGSGVPATLNVRMEVSKLRLLAHRFFNRPVGRVLVDLTGTEPGPTIVQKDIAPGDVRDGRGLPLSGAVVKAITSERRLRLRLDTLLERPVPVDVVTKGELPENRRLLSAPVAVPDSVRITGPSRFFTGEERVRTEPVSLGRLRESSERTCRLVAPHPFLVLATDQVAVRFSVAEVKQRHFPNVPVVALHDADQPGVGVEPAFAELVLSGPGDSLRAVLPSRIWVIVTVSGLPEGIHRVPGQVDIPDFLEVVSLTPETFVARVGVPDSLLPRGDGP